MKRIWVIGFLLVICAASIGTPRSSAAAQAWQPLPGPIGGSVAALAMSPDYTNDHTVFAGLHGHGVYRTTNGGDSWQAAGLSDQVIVDLTISPDYATDHTIFAVAGLSPAGFNIYRSIDGGATWQTPDIMPYAYGFKPLLRLSISPDFAHDHTIYALNGAETYKSNDGGLTYLKAGGWFASHTITHLAISPAYASDHILFAAVQNDQLYRSIDGGAHWNPAGVGGNVIALALSPDYPNDHTLAAISGPAYGTGYLRVSYDDGVSWNTPPWMFGWDGQARLLFSPSFASDRLMLASSSTGLGPLRSSDGGQTWTQIDPAGFEQRSIFALALAPDTAADAAAFLGTTSGLYRSTNRGANWYPRNDGLPRLTIRKIALAPGDPNRLLVATSYFEQQRTTGSIPVESDSNLQLSLDGGQTWREVSGRIDLVQQVVFSPDVVHDQIALACNGVIDLFGNARGGVLRSTDAGATWQSAYATAVCKTLALSPNFAVDHTAWAYFSDGPVYSGIYRSTDGGATWSLWTNAVVADLIVPSPNYAIDQTLFVATADSRVMKSTDGGAQWWPDMNQAVTALTISPAYGASQTLYSAAPLVGGLLRKTAADSSWYAVNPNIPATSNGQPVHFAVLDFAADGSVVAGVTYGSSEAAIYRSVDGGSTWQIIGAGLDQFNLFDVTSTSNKSEGSSHGALTFYAATSGGLWRIDQDQRDPTEPGTWFTAGPRGGRADVLAVSPNFVNDGVAFTGESNWFHFNSQYGRGIFKSTDWGQTWRASNDGLQTAVQYPGYAVNGFAFSPDFATDKTVFETSWDGLYKSTDGGDNWQLLANGIYDLVAVAPDYPTSGHMLVRGVYGCLYRTADFGQHWSYDCSVHSPTIAYSSNFAADHTIFIASNGISRSVDGGLTWTSVFTAPAYRVAVSPQYGVDQTIFASGDALYKSTDGGATWITLTAGVGLPTFSPAFATDHVLFAAGGNQLYRSDDGGTTWHPLPGWPNMPIGPIAISPGWPTQPYLLIGTAQGVYRSTDGGATWARMPALTTLAASALAHSTDEALWLTGTTNGLQASPDAGSTWFPFGLQSLKGNISTIAFSPAYSDDRTLFVVSPCPDCIGYSFLRTTNGGITWDRLSPGGQTISSLAISPHYASDRTLFASNYDRAIIRSTDSGDSWVSIGTWPSERPGVPIVALPPNYPADSTVFAAGAGIWHLPPGETVWQPAASGLLSMTNVSALAIAPNYTQSQTLLAASVDYAINGVQSAVFRSADGGIHWQRSDIGVPDGELRSIAFSPNYAADHTVYLVSATQLYRSLDDGQRWTTIGAPPGWPELKSVAVNRSGQVIITSNAGVWRYTTGFRDAVIDGDAESGSGWELIGNAGAVRNVIFNGQQSLRLGLDNEANTAIDSAAIQTVTIPVSATVAQLNFRAYAVSSEVTVASHDRSSTSGDAQYVTITPSGTATISSTLLWTLSNAQMWQHYSFDLTRFAGQTIVLRLGVLNDGLGGQTALYIDNASLITLGPSGKKVYLPVVLKNITN